MQLSMDRASLRGVTETNLGMEQLALRTMHMKILQDAAHQGYWQNNMSMDVKAVGQRAEPAEHKFQRMASNEGSAVSVMQDDIEIIKGTLYVSKTCQQILNQGGTDNLVHASTESKEGAGVRNSPLPVDWGLVHPAQRDHLPLGWAVACPVGPQAGPAAQPWRPEGAQAADPNSG